MAGEAVGRGRNVQRHLADARWQVALIDHIAIQLETQALGRGRVQGQGQDRWLAAGGQHQLCIGQHSPQHRRIPKRSGHAPAVIEPGRQRRVGRGQVAGMGIGPAGLVAGNVPLLLLQIQREELREPGLEVGGRFVPVHQHGVDVEEGQEIGRQSLGAGEVGLGDGAVILQRCQHADNRILHKILEFLLGIAAGVAAQDGLAVVGLPPLFVHNDDIGLAEDIEAIAPAHGQVQQRIPAVVLDHCRVGRGQPEVGHRQGDAEMLEEDERGQTRGQNVAPDRLAHPGQQCIGPQRHQQPQPQEDHHAVTAGIAVGLEEGDLDQQGEDAGDIGVVAIHPNQWPQRRPQEETGERSHGPGRPAPPEMPQADNRQDQHDVAGVDVLAFIDHKLGTVGPQRRIVADGPDDAPQQGMQLRGGEESQHIRGENVGKTAALHQEIAVGPHIGQHVGQIGQQPQHEHHRGNGRIEEGRLDAIPIASPARPAAKPCQQRAHGDDGDEQHAEGAVGELRPGLEEEKEAQQDAVARAPGRAQAPQQVQGHERQPLRGRDVELPQ